MQEPPPNSDPACLHPVFREKVLCLLDNLNAEGIPFRLFEGFRSLERQQYLYAHGHAGWNSYGDNIDDIPSSAKPFVFAPQQTTILPFTVSGSEDFHILLCGHFVFVSGFSTRGLMPTLTPTFPGKSDLGGAAVVKTPAAFNDAVSALTKSCSSAVPVTMTPTVSPAGASGSTGIVTTISFMRPRLRASAICGASILPSISSRNGVISTRIRALAKRWQASPIACCWESLKRRGWIAASSAKLSPFRLAAVTSNSFERSFALEVSSRIVAIIPSSIVRSQLLTECSLKPTNNSPVTPMMTSAIPTFPNTGTHNAINRCLCLCDKLSKALPRNASSSSYSRPITTRPVQKVRPLCNRSLWCSSASRRKYGRRAIVTVSESSINYKRAEFPFLWITALALILRLFKPQFRKIGERVASATERGSKPDEYKIT
jgi:hypothetical protein